MRALRLFLASAVLGSVLVVPTTALANGGSYIEFRPSTGQGRGTHFLSGGPATGVATVYVPRQHRSLFGRGPFYAFLLSPGAAFREGRPIPAGAVRLGTFSIAHRAGMRFDLTVDFTVPSVPGELYSVVLCNVPCTVSGFRETLTGSISIVATAREARLLTVLARLRSKLSESRGDLRRVERRVEGIQLLLDRRERDVALAEARELRLELAIAAARAESASRIPWAWLVAMAGALAIVLLIAMRRRNGRIVVPDTIEELQAGSMERSEHEIRPG